MEVEQLIKAIRDRPALWDRMSLKYENDYKELSEKCWNEVCEEVNETKEKVKKKWKGLRDTYRFELRKYLCVKNSHLAEHYKIEYQPIWPYFKKMSFLKDHVNIRVIESVKITKRKVESAVNNNPNTNNKNSPNEDLANFEKELMDIINTNKESNSKEISATKSRQKSSENEIVDDIDIKPTTIELIESDNSYTEENLKIVDDKNVLEEILQNESDDNENDSTINSNNTNEDNNDNNTDIYSKNNNINNNDEDSNENINDNIEKNKLNDSKRKWYEIGEKIIDLESEKINLLKKHKFNDIVNSNDINNYECIVIKKIYDADEEQHFFNSLIPHIKKLEPAKKLKCQIDIQKLIFDYCYNNKE